MMKQEKHNNQTQEEALKLLPWYNAGLLQKKDVKYFEKALEKYPELQKELELDNQISSLIKEEKQLADLSLCSPANKRLDNVLNQLEHQQDTHKVKTYYSSLRRLGKHLSQVFFRRSLPRFQYIATATVSIMLIFLAYAFISPIISEKSTFYPAAGISNSNNHSDITVILIGLKTHPSDPKLITLLQEFTNAKLEATSEREKIYRLLLPKKLTSFEVKTLIKTLLSEKELVWFAGEAY